MIKSRYNHIIKHESKYYIYNILSNSLIQVSEDLIKRIQNNDYNNIDLQKLDILKQNGIVVENDAIELQYLQFKHNLLKYDRHQESYLIYPTLKCNFSCPYCFEKTERKSISRERLITLKNFFLSRISDNKLTFLHLRWSGGEPLLLWNDIKNIIHEVREECKTNRIDFSSSLATNGSLISEEIAKEINESSISKVTISIDGPSHIHNERRYYKTGLGSFDDVINGVNNLSKFQKVILRVNIDKSNYLFYNSLLIELNNLLKYKHNISIYLKPVVPSLDCGLDSSMYDDFEFYSIEKSLIEVSHKMGFNVEFHPGYNKATRCPAYQNSSYMIDPELNVYKCSIQIGIKEKRVGYITKDNNLNIEKYHECYEYTNLNPFENYECKECNILPLCNGKCPVRWHSLQKKENQGCISEKFTLTDKIKYFVIEKYLKNGI